MLLLLRKVYNFLYIVFSSIFQYLITGTLDDSCYLYNFESFLKTGTTFAVLSTEGKTSFKKVRLNKSANCFEMSFFRRNNIL